MEENIISNLNQNIKVNISIDEEDNLTFKAYNEDNQKLYSKNFEFEEIKKNNYFYLSENISDIFNELQEFFKEKKVIIFDENDYLKFIFTTSIVKIKEIHFHIPFIETKYDENKIQNLEKTLNDLFLKIEEIKVEKNKEINELKNKIAILEIELEEIKNENKEIKNILFEHNIMKNNIQKEENLYNNNNNINNNNNNYNLFKSVLIDNNINNKIQNNNLLNEFNLFNENKENKNKDLNLITTIFSHNEIVTCILILRNKNICSCSKDTYIKIFDPQNFNEITSFQFEKVTILHIMEMTDLNLVACLSDFTINILKIQNNSICIIEYLLGHQDYVYKSIEYNKNSLITCSSDKTIKMWCRTDGYFQVINSIDVESKVNDILLIYDYLIVCSCFNGQFLKFYDLNSYKCVKILYNVCCSDFNNTLFKYNDEILFVGGVEFLYIINLLNFSIIETIATNNYIESLCVINEKNILFTGDDEGNLKKWKIKENGKKLELIENYDKVHSKWLRKIIRLDNDKIITCSDDFSIKIFNLNKLKLDKI